MSPSADPPFEPNQQGISLDKLAAAFAQAISLDSGLVAAHNNAGSAYFQQGRYGQARGEWETARALEAGNATAGKNLNTLESLGY